MSAAPAILSPSAKGRETLKRVKKFVKENVDPIENVSGFVSGRKNIDLGLFSCLLILT